ncbi:chorismate synthase, partial [Streptococcus pneumoniae]
MRYLTAGESHGPRLTAIIEGIPAGLPLTAEDINEDLRRRQGGYGRGGRMKIESDQVVFTSGVRHGKTTGAPITMDVINKDHQKWLDIMSAEDIEDRLKSKRKITHPRPGHADLVGGIKYRFDDLRNSLERSSARETTMRVAVGAVAKRLLAELDMEIANHVVVFGGKEIDVPENLTVAEIKQRAAQSEVSIVNQEREQEIKDYIDQIKRDGDTIGGVVETVVGG